MHDLFDSLAKSNSAPAAPALRTARLLLRPLCPADAAEFHRLINDWDICRTLPDAPFPYPAQLATDWIEAAAADRAAGKAHQFAIVQTATGTLIGCAGLRLSRDQKSAELGYWLGRRHWGEGFAAEAAARLTAWGFSELLLPKITATVSADNPASIAILRRAGFAQTGKGNQAFLCRPGAQLPVLHFAARREEPAGGRADQISEAAFDIHVNVLQRALEFKRSAADL